MTSSPPPEASQTAGRRLQLARTMVAAILLCAVAWSVGRRGGDLLAVSRLQALRGVSVVSQQVVFRRTPHGPAGAPVEAAIYVVVRNQTPVIWSADVGSVAVTLSAPDTQGRRSLSAPLPRLAPGQATAVVLRTTVLVVPRAAPADVRVSTWQRLHDWDPPAPAVSTVVVRGSRKTVTAVRVIVTNTTGARTEEGRVLVLMTQRGGYVAEDGSVTVPTLEPGDVWSGLTSLSPRAPGVGRDVPVEPLAYLQLSPHGNAP